MKNIYVDGKMHQNVLSFNICMLLASLSTYALFGFIINASKIT